jgi:hypothetical protein
MTTLLSVTGIIVWAMAGAIEKMISRSKGKLTAKLSKRTQRKKKNARGCGN